MIFEKTWRKLRVFCTTFFQAHCVFKNYRIDATVPRTISIFCVSNFLRNRVRHGHAVVFRITCVIYQVWIQANASSPRSSYLRVMAGATATSKQNAPTTNDQKAKAADQLFNPFYSPPGHNGGSETYQYAELKVRLPDSSYLFY